jgi:hypothetical protein
MWQQGRVRPFSGGMGVSPIFNTPGAALASKELW